jgi:glucans biosynthesis protein C
MTQPTDGPTTAPPTAAPPRLPSLDNLRVVLTVLVVLFHVALSYGNLPIWYYHEPADDPSGVALDLFVIVTQMFFMGGFFLISGFLTPGSYDRSGGRRYVRNRLVRLGVPLLIFLVVLRPLVNFGGFRQLREAFAAQGTSLSYWEYYLISWDPGPLWFVELLLVFTLVYALLRRRRDPVTAAGTPARAPGLAAVAAFVVALGLATFAWRILVPIGTYWPIVGLPSPAYLPQYAMLFAVGAMAYRRGWLTALPRRAGRIGLAAAGVALVVLTVFGLLPGQATSPTQLVATALGEAVVATGIIVGLLVLFRERWNTQGSSGRFLSTHAYAVYVIHPLVLVALGYAFTWLDATAVVKFLVVAVLAVPLCWLAAALVRSLPRADRVL